MSSPRPTCDGLALLMPGLLHQLGNQLFAIQGHAQLLPAGDATRGAMLAAAARSTEVLGLWRAVLEGRSAGRLDLERALALLGDVARVGLRERGHGLTLTLGGATGEARCEAAAVLAATAQALQGLCDLVPGGVDGEFALAAAAERRAVTIRIQFVPRPGSLPFPMATATLASRWPGAHADGAVQGRALADGIELLCPAATDSSAAEA
ncbi:MAG: hypothetical protein KF830_13520 [Planctomycetes bacterium]|nr:hypothetical protein [Planctomycetota bacterium]